MDLPLDSRRRAPRWRFVGRGAPAAPRHSALEHGAQPRTGATSTSSRINAQLHLDNDGVRGPRSPRMTVTASARYLLGTTCEAGRSMPPHRFLSEHRCAHRRRQIGRAREHSTSTSCSLPTRAGEEQTSGRHFRQVPAHCEPHGRPSDTPPPARRPRCQLRHDADLGSARQLLFNCTWTRNRPPLARTAHALAHLARRAVDIKFPCLADLEPPRWPRRLGRAAHRAYLAALAGRRARSPRCQATWRAASARRRGCSRSRTLRQPVRPALLYRLERARSLRDC